MNEKNVQSSSVKGNNKSKRDRNQREIRRSRVLEQLGLSLILQSNDNGDSEQTNDMETLTAPTIAPHRSDNNVHRSDSMEVNNDYETSDYNIEAMDSEMMTTMTTTTTMSNQQQTVEAMFTPAMMFQLFTHLLAKQKMDRVVAQKGWTQSLLPNPVMISLQYFGMLLYDHTVPMLLLLLLL